MVTAAVLTAPALIVLAQLACLMVMGVRSSRTVGVLGSLAGLSVLVCHLANVFFAKDWFFCQVTTPGLGRLEDILSYRVSRKCYN